MMLLNGDFLLTRPAEVSKQFFYIMGIVFFSIPIDHSVKMKETHNSMDHLLSAVNYEQKWLDCGDPKVVGLVPRLQGGSTKYPCFLYLWDIWADNQHYVRQEWTLRQGFKPCSHNVQFHPLIKLNKILFLRLHIKFGVMKNFVQAMDRKGSNFDLLQEKFPRIWMEKLKAGIFDGLQIGELMKDPMFDEVLSETELFAW